MYILSGESFTNLHFSGKGDNPQIPNICPPQLTLAREISEKPAQFIQVKHHEGVPVASLIACTASCQPNKSIGRIKFLDSKILSGSVLAFLKTLPDFSKLKKTPLKGHMPGNPPDLFLTTKIIT